MRKAHLRGSSDNGAVTQSIFVDAELNGSQPRFWIGDHLGSLGAVVDSSGAAIAKYEYDPWGRRLLSSGSDATAFGFTGHEWDDVLEMWLAQYRAYDPALGRWASQDPAGRMDGPNLYAYVRNAPIILRDLQGLWAGGPDSVSVQLRPSLGVGLLMAMPSQSQIRKETLASCLRRWWRRQWIVHFSRLAGSNRCMSSVQVNL